MGNEGGVSAEPASTRQALSELVRKIAVIARMAAIPTSDMATLLAAPSHVPAAAAVGAAVTGNAVRCCLPRFRYGLTEQRPLLPDGIVVRYARLPRLCTSRPG